MKGYEEEDKLSECQECAKVLKENEDIIETEFEDEIYNFCSEECAEKFERKHKK